MKASEMLHILKVQNKRLFIIWLVTFVAFIGLLGYTIWLLNDIAQYEGTLLDKRDFVINYLDRTYQRLKGIRGSVGYVSSQFPNNTLLITMKGHITCSKPDRSGIPTIYDTFDCRDREVEYVWLVN